ncbi:hypothetical protein [Sandaracinus amylolyticus]|uniref:hypothetical protein n=1 Tax=Sandaracinus amylolyticus TaxID=927083 RepID=UPI0012ED9069|nr:hypothetical protein [Sandaracinus amylolyticus]
MHADTNSLLGSEPVETHPIIKALLRFGYSIEWHGEPGSRLCIVSDPDETFEGRGVDDRKAFEEALARLAPSKIARALIERAASQMPRAAGSAEVQVTPRPDLMPRLELEHTPAPPSGPRDLKAILSDLQTVAARVEAGIPEAALMAPPLQKLHVLAWISRARALEHEANRNRSASDATGAIARRLTTLCKTWWPGSVRALQLDATPERATREQGLPPATKWLDVAETAEARLEQLIAEPPSDDGWRDTAALSAPPDDASREIALAIRIIERLVGPIDTPPGNDAPRPLASNDELQLEDAAARLRWARHVAPDPERWGAAIGRLRWLVAQKRGSQRLARLLDPGFVPRPSWDHEAGAARSRLVALTPPPDSGPELMKWLTATFDAIDGPTLASRLREQKTVSGAPAAPLILSIQEGDLPAGDRRLRRRLRQLHALMTGGKAGESTTSTQEMTSTGEQPVLHVDDEAAAARPTHDERIFTRVRAKLPEAAALFVSNREDPMLRERLEKALGWQIEWSTAEPRRVAAIAGAIGRGKYRVVLSATGFQDHSTDIALARAAQSSNTLYVRVNRGRAAACARALARELGIRTDDGEEERAAG